MGISFYFCFHLCFVVIVAGYYFCCCCSSVPLFCLLKIIGIYINICFIYTYVCIYVIHTRAPICVYQLIFSHATYYFISGVALRILKYKSKFTQSTLSLYLTTLQKSQKIYNNIIHFAVAQISAISTDVFPFFIIHVSFSCPLLSIYRFTFNVSCRAVLLLITFSL